MPTTPRPVVARVLVVAVLAGALGACGLLPPGAVPVGLDPVLVTYETAGGECPTGACGFTAAIHRDGTVVRSDGMAQVVEASSMERLAREVDAADWAAILARPFGGECPRNVDGQEETYTFHLLPAPVVVASCTVAIDPQQEPFQTVREILFAIGG